MGPQCDLKIAVVVGKREDSLHRAIHRKRRTVFRPLYPLAIHIQLVGPSPPSSSNLTLG
jgi:hypothetical protein